MSHQQFWCKVKNSFASLRLTIFLLVTLSVTSLVAGHVSKNPAVFAKTFVDIADAVRAKVPKEVAS